MTGVRITLDDICRAARKSSEPAVKPIPKDADLTGWLDDLVQKAEKEAPRAPPAQSPDKPVP